MNNINRVVLVGRLTRDAELRYTQANLAICTMSMAVNRRKKQQDEWVDEAHFFDIVLFGRLGESIAQYLLKGKQIAVDGELRQNRWEQDGQKRSKVEIVADTVQLLSGSGDSKDARKSSDHNTGGSHAPPPASNNAPSPSQPPNTPPPSQGAQPPIDGSDFDDDIPF